jgi:hypothetical protein
MNLEQQPAVRSYAETFGIEPSVYEREIPEVIRGIAPALRRFEDEAGSDEEIRELFSGVYDSKKIDSDLAEVHRLERAFDKDDSLADKRNVLYATTLELVIQDVANEWFPDCVVWRSNKFDDYKRQTDLFMDIPHTDDNPLTLALDVTAGREAAKRKLEQSLGEYQLGRFHDIEYFASDVDDSRPRGRTNMPRCVVGAAPDAIARLARLYGQWLRHSAIGSSLTKEQAMERLRWHELGGQLYEQLLSQIKNAHDIMRKELKNVPTFQETRRDALKKRARYLEEVRRAIDERYRAWKKGREEYLQRNKDAESELEAPVNGVLEAILQGAV